VTLLVRPQLSSQPTHMYVVKVELDGVCGSLSTYCKLQKCHIQQRSACTKLAANYGPPTGPPCPADMGHLNSRVAGVCNDPQLLRTPIIRHGSIDIYAGL